MNRVIIAAKNQEFPNVGNIRDSSKLKSIYYYYPELNIIQYQLHVNFACLISGADQVTCMINFRPFSLKTASCNQVGNYTNECGQSEAKKETKKQKPMMLNHSVILRGPISGDISLWVHHNRQTRSYYTVI